MSECYRLKIIEGKRPWFCQIPEGRILIPASESNFVTVEEWAVCCDSEWRNLMINIAPFPLPPHGDKSTVVLTGIKCWLIYDFQMHTNMVLENK